MTVKVTRLGHAAVRLDWEGHVVVIDPFFTGNPMYKEEWKPEKIDLLLVTHGHNDHFGDTIALAQEFSPTIPVIHEMSVFIQNKIGESGATVVGMNFGGTYTHSSGIKVSLVPSSHSSGFSDDAGMHYLGNPGGYVVTFPDGNSVYHCGDTGVSADMKVIRKLFRPTIGLLAIGGHYTMDPKGAAYAARMMKLRKVVPIHYGTWNPPLAGTPDELRAALHKTKVEVFELNPGESHEFMPPEPKVKKEKKHKDHEDSEHMEPAS